MVKANSFISMSTGIKKIMRLAIFSQGGTLALLYLHLESLFYGVRNVSRIRRKGPPSFLTAKAEDYTPSS